MKWISGFKGLKSRYTITNIFYHFNLSVNCRPTTQNLLNLSQNSSQINMTYPVVNFINNLMVGFQSKQLYFEIRRSLDICKYERIQIHWFLVTPDRQHIVHLHSTCYSIIFIIVISHYSISISKQMSLRRNDTNVQPSPALYTWYNIRAHTS